MADFHENTHKANNHHHGTNKIPETKIGTEGTAKRNIIRKGGAASLRKEGSTGQMVDDGSLYQDPSALDEHDPNYDSEDDSNKDYVPRTSGLLRRDIAKAKLTLTAYKKLIQPVIQEYFSSFDIDDVAISIQEIGAPEYSYEFVKRVINASIDKGDEEREHTSQLLSALFPTLLSFSSIGKGFERLFEIVDEIELDAPNTKSIVAAYVARAVVDEILPPAFLNDYVVCNLGGEIIEQAKLLLSRDHAYAKVERIWGPGDGRPVEELKIAVDQLLEEYINSSDMEEAVRCLRELNSPFFFHEVIKRAVVLSLDKTPEQQSLISELFGYLAFANLMSQQQAVKGFNRLYEALPDIALDVPSAGQLLQTFTQRALDDKVIPSSYQPPAAKPVDA